MCFSYLCNTATSSSTHGIPLALAIRFMNITIHAPVVYLLHAYTLGRDAFSLAKVVLVNIIILIERLENIFCILYIQVHLLLLAKQLDDLGNKLDGKLDVHGVIMSGSNWNIICV
jgi:hypothetical protein